MPDPRDDPRSVDELLAAILGSNQDEDRYWDDVWAVQCRATPEVLGRAVALGRSACPHERRAGAAILGQFGSRLELGPDGRVGDDPGPRFGDERLDALAAMLAVERDDEALAGILFALGHLHRPEAIGAVVALRGHANADVRYAVVHALQRHEDDRAIAALIELSRDEATDVRDWATFGLGSMVAVDTPDIRRALVDRLDDPDGTTRAEAMVGLGRLRDDRVLPALRADLAAGGDGPMELEAAALLGAPELLPLLAALRGRDDVDADSLAEAIAACSPPGAGAGA